MKNKYAFIAVFVCFTLLSSWSQANEKGIDYLLQQLSFQMGQGDLFQAEKTLSKINKVEPNNPIYLQENIRFLIEAARFSEARIALIKIKKRIATSEYQALAQLFDIYYTKRDLLSKARLLGKRKLYQQSLDSYNELFLSKDPHYSLALEYWDVITEVNPELEATVLFKLERLNKQYPANTRIKLAYFKYSLRAGKNKQQIYDELYLLTFNTVWKSEAKRLWQYGLLNTEVTTNNQALFLTYSELFPNDTRINYHLKEGNDAIAKHNNLMRDPAYRAKIRLPGMLDNDAPLDKIALTLATAKTKYANDQVVVISQGQYLFRKKDYTGAINTFKRCAKLFTPVPAKCTLLLTTTRYWRLIDNVERALDNQQFDQAQKSLNTLYTFKDESNYHILLDGRLNAQLGNYPKAEQKYAYLLSQEPLSRQYLTTMMEFKNDHLGKQNMDNWFASLSLQQTNILLGDYHALLIAKLRNDADQSLAKGNEQKAESLLLSALQLVPMHPWASYDLAKLYINQGNREQALNLYKPLSDDVEVIYSYSLILATLDDYAKALNVLTGIAPASRTSSINNDIVQYQFELAMINVDNAEQNNRLALLLNAKQQYANNPIYIDRIQQQMLKYGFLQQVAQLADDRLRGHSTNNLDNEPEKRIELLLQLAQVQLLSDQTDKALASIEQVYSLNSQLFNNKLKLSELSLALIKTNDLNSQSHQSLNQKLNQLLAELAIEQPQSIEVWQQRLELADVNSDWAGVWKALTNVIALEPVQSYRYYQLFGLFEDHNDEINVSDNQFKQRHLIPFIQTFPFHPIGYDIATRLYGRLPELNEDASSLVKKGYYSALMTDIGDSAEFDIRDLANQDELLQGARNSSLSNAEQQQLQRYYDQMYSKDRVSNIEVTQGSWLVNRFQSVLQETSLKQNRHLELGVKHYQKSGDQGLSEYDLSVISLAYVAPMDNDWLGVGQWYVKVDPTIIDAGTLDTDASVSERFGSVKLCDARCDDKQIKQQEVGTSIAIGFKNESVTADIGTKPIGFNLFDWVGGISYRNSLWNIGWSLGASKRPVTSSLLSFAGADDPYSTITWGGASIYNFGTSLSYDQGTGWGIWAVADVAAISGKQIEFNERQRAMGGIYWDWFNRDWFNASIGLNLFTWQYQQDLSEYTLGQGGYYSPQEYKSASIPLNFYGRVGDFSYQVDISASLSESSDKDMEYYPFHPNYQAAHESFSNEAFIGGQSTGEGYSFNAMLEYKLTNHWTLGTNITIQQSEYFSPNSFYFYVKYYLEPNLQPANIRPDPVTIYMDY